jgi:hypothetical protein
MNQNLKNKIAQIYPSVPVSKGKQGNRSGECTNRPTVNPSSNVSAFQNNTVAEIEAWARRASSASGFGGL